MEGGCADGEGGVAGEVGVKEAKRVGGRQAPREGPQHLEHCTAIVWDSSTLCPPQGYGHSLPQGRYNMVEILGVASQATGSQRQRGGMTWS